MLGNSVDSSDRYKANPSTNTCHKVKKDSSKGTESIPEKKTALVRAV